LVLQAEGYLELGMARHALDVLARWGDPQSLPDHALYLKGQGLRELGRYREALEPLSRAAHGDPGNISIWLALGWCYKRTGKLDRAIESLEEALTVEPNDALVHYNLACYWSLAHNKRQALVYLSRAFDLEDELRALVADESDFDAVRDDPAFQALVRVTV
jgi:Flp pilus assembly protein TadD